MVEMEGMWMKDGEKHRASEALYYEAEDFSCLIGSALLSTN